jgi:hypothetical protein
VGEPDADWSEATQRAFAAYRQSEVVKFLRDEDIPSAYRYFGYLEALGKLNRALAKAEDVADIRRLQLAIAPMETTARALAADLGILPRNRQGLGILDAQHQMSALDKFIEDGRLEEEQRANEREQARQAQGSA